MQTRDALLLALGIGAVGLLLPSALGIAGGTMLSVSAIANYARNAGFSGQDLLTAVAIALAESSGNPNAHGDLTLPGPGSFGLWQIYAHSHPEFGPDFTQLYDPQTNANAAFSVYQAAGYSFQPWSTYKNGAYQVKLETVQQTVSV